jgi:archaellum component FlaC
MFGFWGTSQRDKRSGKAALLLWSVLLILMVLVLASCAKPPETELAAAEAELSRAQNVEAPVYAASDYRAAQDSLDAARNEVDRQDAKFALFRNYGAAKEKAVAARETARRAADAAAGNKEAKREEAERTLAEVQQAIADVREKLDSDLGKRLARAKGQRQAITQIREELDAREAVLEEVRQAQLEERYADAARTAEGALRDVRSLDEEVSRAITKLTEGS